MFENAFFSPDTPSGLVHRLYLCFLEIGERISFYTNLTWDRVDIQEDRVVIKGTPDKNHPGGVSSLHSEKHWDRILFANTSNPRCCVIATINLYRSHLPQDLHSDAAVFLSALKSPKGDIWYSKVKVGKNTLGMYFLLFVCPSFIFASSRKLAFTGRCSMWHPRKGDKP